MAFFTTFRRENPSAIGANNKCLARKARAIQGDRANGAKAKECFWRGGQKLKRIEPR